MNSDALIAVQRRLRHHLDTSRQHKAIAGASDLAAHLLLYLDDTDRCWQLTLQWLRSTFDADRVDGGFAHQGSRFYRPIAETLRQDIYIPSSANVTIDAQQTAVLAVLGSHRPVLFESVQEDIRFTAPLRHQLLSLHTHAKLAMSLHDGNTPIGIICCDWTRAGRLWRADQCEQIGHFADKVLSPIFTVIQEFNSIIAPAKAEDTPIKLTATELKVARLIVQGLSYKEIARQLNRSFSTVDHRLRSIRDKLGARSTARMVSVLRELLNQYYP